MRQILLNDARSRMAAKRGGENQRVELHENLLVSDQLAEEILALDEALKKLELRDERPHIGVAADDGEDVDERAEQNALDGVGGQEDVGPVLLGVPGSPTDVDHLHAEILKRLLIVVELARRPVGVGPSEDDVPEVLLKEIDDRLELDRSRLVPLLLLIL